MYVCVTIVTRHKVTRYDYIWVYRNVYDRLLISIYCSISQLVLSSGTQSYSEYNPVYCNLPHCVFPYMTWPDLCPSLTSLSSPPGGDTDDEWLDDGHLYEALDSHYEPVGAVPEAGDSDDDAAEDADKELGDEVSALRGMGGFRSQDAWIWIWYVLYHGGV